MIAWDRRCSARKRVATVRLLASGTAVVILCWAQAFTASLGSDVGGGCFPAPPRSTALCNAA